MLLRLIVNTENLEPVLINGKGLTSYMIVAHGEHMSYIIV